MSTVEEIIGRTDPNDFEAVLAMTNTDPNEVIHAVEDNAECIYSWDYEKGARPQLAKLYEKAKVGQWNGETDLPWDTDVDQEALAVQEYETNGGAGEVMDLSGTGVESWGRDEWVKFNMESQNWALSHVEVFAKYLDTKLSDSYPINVHLRMLLDDIIEDSRWDMTYLGMQIMVEGLALAAFGFMYQQSEEPLLKQLLRYVMSDEARHVAFGILSLKEVYQDMTQAELRDRQEFAFEAAVRMRDRFLQQEVWERMGADVKKVIPLAYQDPLRQEFQQLLFTKIVPNCKKLGLLDAGDGWLRTKFGEIGVLQYEDWVDTSEEVDAFAISRELEAEQAS